MKKQDAIVDLFADANTPEEVYQKIIEMGRCLPFFQEEEKRDENRVQGCQSILYLLTTFHDGRLTFQAHSEALISAGLAYLLLYVYNNEPPEVVLKCPPTFLETLGIPDALSPSRSNGLASLYLRMKQDTLNYLINKSN